MQEDMHYYGTYVIARAAGVPPNDASVIAYAAQFVDDSTKQDSEPHDDGGLLFGIATAHTLKDSINFNESEIDREDQRRVWVPFHFLPSGVGKNLEEKMLCGKDSELAQQMIKRHVEEVISKKIPFGLHLLGIACHVYMDTFAHYGFSGIGSNYNKVHSNSIKFIDVKDKGIESYIKQKAQKFKTKYLRPVESFFGELASSDLGHAGVSTFPDRPFLHWECTYEISRPIYGTISNRNNPETFVEGCQKLHTYLCEFARNYYADSMPVDFSNISNAVERIIRFEGDKKSRIDKWVDAVNADELFARINGEAIPKYDKNDWESEKRTFHELKSSESGLMKNVYKFHQAAAIHRYYVLKDLLPSHGIAVY